MSVVQAWILYKQVNNSLMPVRFQNFHCGNIDSWRQLKVIKKEITISWTSIFVEMKKKNRITYSYYSIRLDGMCHLAFIPGTKNEYKYPGRTGVTKIRCEKCYHHLWLTVSSNYFKILHTKQTNFVRWKCLDENIWTMKNNCA